MSYVHGKLCPESIFFSIHLILLPLHNFLQRIYPMEGQMREAETCTHRQTRISDKIFIYVKVDRGGGGGMSFLYLSFFFLLSIFFILHSTSTTTTTAHIFQEKSNR